MIEISLPQIDYNSFSDTRNTIQLYAQLISAIKGSFLPHQKNWEEFSLKIYGRGFTTTSIPIKTKCGKEALDLNLDLIGHKLIISYKYSSTEITLEQISTADFTNKLLDILNSFEIKFKNLDDKFFKEEKLIYNKNQATKLWVLFREIYFLFLEFRGTTLYETSNINFWPHHFDLALLIFSGKMIDGEDKTNWDYSREQMNFGLSSGDQEIKQPYFYVTAYPFKKNITDIKLPKFAEWHTEGWNGLVIKLDNLFNKNGNYQLLLELFTKILNKNY